MKNIIEGNKLIAEFMGCRLHPNGTYSIKVLDEVESWHPETMCYVGSWDWLMPVVEKIEELGYYTEINTKQPVPPTTYVHISSPKIPLNKFHISTGGVKSKIEAVWLAVVEFIEWYNQNK